MKKNEKIVRNRRETLVLLMVMVLAGFLRFYQLGKIPASPDWDEAALGYNAFSILKTGRDEFGEKLPVVLRSFGDYKPALYAYLAILPVKVLGLNTLATRFPAAFLGTLAVLAVYFMVKELFPKQSGIPHLPLVCAFLLAVSPWHLQFSRAAFESGTGMFFNILIALFFLKGLKKPWFLALSAFFAGLNFYAYQAEKVFTPLLVLSLFLIWRRRLFKIPRRYLMAAVSVGLIVLAPFIYKSITSPEIFLRAKGTSFSSDQTTFLARTAGKLIRDGARNDYLGLALDNRRITYFIAFTGSYLSHFDLDWLFLRGDDTRHHAPGMGLLYLWELPFFLWGIYAAVFEKRDFRTKALVFAWFFLAPLPAAFTSGTPHAVRALRFLPVVQIFTGLGLINFWRLLAKRPKLKLWVIVPAAVLVIFNFGYYYNQYFSQLNYFTAEAWQYGYEPAIAKIKEVENDYDRIIVSSQPPLDQSYVFFLFFLKYDPAAYLYQGGTAFGERAEERNSFGKYSFRSIKWEEEVKNGRTLFVGRPGDFPEEAKLIEEVNFLNGEPVIKIVER